jgi:glycine dehydrogenase subunit 2
MPKNIFEKSSVGRKGYNIPKNDVPQHIDNCIPEKYRRKEQFRFPEVSELDVMRHFVELSNMNHCIEKGFYPLGSCTMKYNPKIHETLVRNCGFMNIHPLQDENTVQGAIEVMYEVQKDLAEISGFAGVTLQPAAGAQGEFTGLKIIQAYHQAKGNTHKTKIILPDSSHGTNPASAALVGYNTVQIKSDDNGRVDVEALKAVVDDSVAGFMITNPNTLGIFEDHYKEIAEIIHSVDGLVYLDGANFNALLGIVRPGQIGFDVMHFNLHKTFSTPHGGGGPGSGPVGVRADLLPYLPYPVANKEGERYFLDESHINTSIGKVQTFYGNFGVYLRAYIYIKMLGNEGVRRASENAIINANYLLAKLKDYYPVPYPEGCLHEFVASGAEFKEKYGIKTLDIAKRLLDMGYHAPTVYFPLIVPEAIMIEPTETESKETLDEFIQAMITIAEEAKNDSDKLKSAPQNTPVKRVDDVKAARELDIKFNL